MRKTDWSQAVKFFAPLTRSKKIHSNFVFRFSFCGLSDDIASNSAGVSLEQVYNWDDGETIPESVKRIWLYESGRKLPSFSGFEGFSISRGRFVTPDGGSYTSQQVRHALFLLDQLNI